MTVIVAYFFLWQFAIVAQVGATVSALFPAAGFLVFFLHRWGWQYLPAAALAILVGNLPQAPFWEWPGYYYIHMLRQLVVYGGVALLARKCGWLSLPMDSLGAVVRLLTVSLLTSLLSALLAGWIFWLYTPALRSELKVVLAGYWLGDFNGVVMFLGVASVVMALSRQMEMARRTLRTLVSPSKLIILIVSSGTVAGLVVALEINNALQGYGYLIILPVLLGAIAFGLNFGIASAVLANFSAIFANNIIDAQQMSPIQFQLLCAVVICAGMLLGGAIEDRKIALFDAGHDSLTGLLNRRAFFSQGEIMLENARRYQHSLAIIMLDLDHFKRVNDICGHDQGDYLLCEVAERCRTIVRKGDLAARIGGEEFVLLIEHGDTSKASQVAERLRQQIQQIRLGKHPDTFYSASFGVSIFFGGSQSLSDLLKGADKALYVAKEGGRNQVVVDKLALDVNM